MARFRNAFLGVQDGANTRLEALLLASMSGISLLACGQTERNPGHHDPPGIEAGGNAGDNATTGGEVATSRGGAAAVLECPFEPEAGNGCGSGFASYQLTVCSPDDCSTYGDERCHPRCEPLVDVCPDCAPLCCEVYRSQGGDVVELAGYAVCSDQCFL